MTTKLARVFVIAGLMGGAGCGGDDDDGGGAPDAAAPDAAPPGPLLDPPPDGEGLQLVMNAPIEIGEEITYCQYYVLPAGASMDIGRFEHRYSEGSHHLLLFPTSLTPADVAGDLERFDCAARGDLGNRGVAYGAQAPEGEFAYPAGIAMHFEPESVVLLQAHYLNTTDEPIDAEVRVNLWFATPPVVDYAGTLFYYDWAIVVPPAPGTATVHMRCIVPGDINLITASSHMHKRGVGYRAELSGGALTQPMELYTTTSWEAPEPRRFDPPLAITAGQVIDYECDYQNDLPQVVVQGPSAATNEMCMFVGGYWPKLSDDAELCFLTDSGPIHAGAATCQQTLGCVSGAATDEARQQCMVDTCAASSLPFNNLVFCMVRSGCNGDIGCIQTNCGAELATCQSATCN